VWRNALGGLTYRLGSDRFVKWSPRPAGPDLGAEAQRLRWAVRWTRVPSVIGAGADQNGSWLVTGALPGTSAVSPHWLADPATAVRAIGRALRRFHDDAPIDLCPYDWSASLRAMRARRRGRPDPADWMAEHRTLPAAAAFARLDAPPAIDRPVVCCGDPCSPNVLLRDDGEPLGLVDLGALGVADRWADLAVATWSTRWNYGPGWEAVLLDSYGIEPDPERTAYYRLLWDLSP
jgi:kanamycin kinase